MSNNSNFMKHIADYISVSRIIMSILIIGTKEFSVPFFIIYSYCGLSDIADGFFARKYNSESKLGEKIDSLADVVFVSATMVKLIPSLNLPKEIIIWIIAIATIKFFGIIYSFICYKKIIFLHTMANKITGFALFVTPFLMVKINSVIIYAFLCALSTFAAGEECHHIIKCEQKLL